MQLPGKYKENLEVSSEGPSLRSQHMKLSYIYWLYLQWPVEDDNNWHNNIRFNKRSRSLTKNNLF
jgi:hypothetical protein